jgi:hypothetical protein
LRVFKLATSAERHWRRLDGANRLGQPIEGIEVRYGEAVQEAEAQVAARGAYTNTDHSPRRHRIDQAGPDEIVSR